MAALRLGSALRGDRCPCGDDLRGAPARSERVHEFDVDGRLRAVKREIACPECGRGFTVWSDAPASDDGAS